MVSKDTKNEQINKDYNIDDKELLNRIESLFFASNNYLGIETISKFADLTIRNTRKAIKLFEKALEERKSPLVLINDNGAYKLSVKTDYAHIVHRVVSQTELTKSLIETLSVIAWKNPILQSEVVLYRHNKAYEHLAELDDKGFITRQVQGRSKLIRLTSKFYEYFDIPKHSTNLKDIMPEDVSDSIASSEVELQEKLKVLDKMNEEKQKQEKEQEQIRENQKENSTLKTFKQE